MLNLRQQKCSKCLRMARESHGDRSVSVFVPGTGCNFASWRSFSHIFMQQHNFLSFSKTKQFPPTVLAHKHVKALRYISIRVAFRPARLRGAFVKGQLIFRLGGQVSHGPSSRWLEWGHNVVMGGGTAGCVCVLKPLNNCCAGGETHQRESSSVFPLSSRCRFTLPRPSAVESSKWQPSDWFAYPWKRWTATASPRRYEEEDHSTHPIGSHLWYI